MGSLRKLCGLALVAIFGAMIVYGARYQKLQVHSRDGKSVSETLVGTKIQVESVKQSVKWTNGAIVSTAVTNAPGAPECPT